MGIKTKFIMLIEFLLKIGILQHLISIKKAGKIKFLTSLNNIQDQLSQSFNGFSKPA